MEGIEQAYVFVQAPDPDRVKLYLLEGGLGPGRAIGRDMLMLEADAGAGSIDGLIDIMNSDMFLQRRVNRVFLCDAIASDEATAIGMLEARIGKSTRLRVQAYPKSAEGRIVDALELHGFSLRPKGFEQVAYVVNLEGRYFVGLYGSGSRFTRDNGREKQLSRAYYKIAEAVERFGISFDSNYRALDIGAAPGSWSKYLSNRVKLCVSVDPARMEISGEKIKHVGKTFQEGIAEIVGYAPYDIVVCDANIDPRDVAFFVLGAPNLISDGGVLLITLKLKHKSGKSVQRAIEETSNMLSKTFNNIAVKRLLSNTLMEATLCAKRI